MNLNRGQKYLLLVDNIWQEVTLLELCDIKKPLKIDIDIDKKTVYYTPKGEL